MKEYYIIVGWYTTGESAYKPFNSRIFSDKNLTIEIGEMYEEVGAKIEIITIKLPI